MLEPVLWCWPAGEAPGEPAGLLRGCGAPEFVRAGAPAGPLELESPPGAGPRAGDDGAR